MPEVIELTARVGPRLRKSVTKSVFGPFWWPCGHFRKLVLPTRISFFFTKPQPAQDSDSQPKLQGSILIVWCPVRKGHQKTTEPGPMAP